MGDKSVQVSISGSFNVKVSSADIIDSFVIKDDIDISEQGVSRLRELSCRVQRQQLRLEVRDKW